MFLDIRSCTLFQPSEFDRVQCALILRLRSLEGGSNQRRSRIASVGRQNRICGASGQRELELPVVLRRFRRCAFRTRVAVFRLLKVATLVLCLLQ